MQRLRALLLVLMAFWLPLQATAAWAMPLCVHPSPESVVAAPHPGDGHSHAHEADEVLLTINGSPGDLCGVCHLASTGFLLAGDTLFSGQDGIDVRVPRVIATSRSHIAEPPRHPPRTTL